MIAPRCLQSSARLRELLDGQLTDAVAGDVTQHLEKCESCRQQLETLAADASWWQEAREHLSAEDNQPVNVEGIKEIPAQAEINVEPIELVSGFLAPPRDPSGLGQLDEYDILEVIGCGGMGIVFKGYDPQLDRFVAIKVLAPHYATSGAARRRFAREAQAAAAVVHPHVLAIHGVNGNSRLPYLVMPYVAGPSLQQRIDEVGPLNVIDVLRIGSQAAQGLAAAHAQGLVHRDIKPANILLENGVQRVLLTDFGLARAIDDVSLTHSGVIAGTPQYMSPEQARGEAVDHRTDLFSLGGVLYTMCAGRPPFRAESTLGVMRRICDVAPRDLRELNPDIPRWMADITARLLAKDRELRFQTADEVAGLLGQFLAHVQQPTAVPKPQVKRSPAGRKLWWKRRLLQVGAGAAVAGGIALAFAFWPESALFDRSTPANDPADRPAVKPDELGLQNAELEWDDGLDAELNAIQRVIVQLDFDETQEEKIDESQK